MTRSEDTPINELMDQAAELTGLRVEYMARVEALQDEVDLLRQQVTKTFDATLTAAKSGAQVVIAKLPERQ